MADEKTTVKAVLDVAAKNTTLLFETYKESGLRITGLNDLLHYLDHVVEVTSRTEALSPLTFFARRAQQDVRVAVVALCSGMVSVVSDVMRDMMEMSYLLREFIHNPAEIKEWFTADSKQRQRRFGPGRLRELHAERLGIDVKDLTDARDYRAHSQALHVDPTPQLVRRGIFDRPDPMLQLDVGFTEIFGHSVQFTAEFFTLSNHLAPGNALDDPKSARVFQDAAINAREFSIPVIGALLKAMSEDTDGEASEEVD